MVIHEGFFFFLAISVRDEAAARKMCQPRRGTMSIFLVIEKTRWVGIPPGPEN